MKKADNFDAKQWLIENKITTQSRLTKEAKDPDSAVSQEARDMFYNAVAKVMEDLYQANIVDDDVIEDYLGIEGGLLGDAIEAYLHSEDLDESSLNEESKKPSIKVLKDLYYFDKLGSLAAKDDVDEKYHDDARLVFKKGKTIKDDTDYDDSDYEMIISSSRLTKGTDYSI
jgi:hypothetical protein